MENLVDNKPISDEDKTKVCLIEDIAKYIKLHNLKPIGTEDFDALMSSEIHEIEHAFSEIKRITENSGAPPYPL